MLLGIFLSLKYFQYFNCFYFICTEPADRSLQTAARRTANAISAEKKKVVQQKNDDFIENVKKACTDYEEFHQNVIVVL